jgi:hypothetical protein
MRSQAESDLSRCRRHDPPRDGRLNTRPASYVHPQGASAPVTITFDGYALQMLTAQSIADPPAIANIPMAWLASDRGNYELAAAERTPCGRTSASAAWRTPWTSPRRHRGAAGAGEERSRDLTLSDTLISHTAHHGHPDADRRGRASAHRSVGHTALFISATLDGRTYPDEAAGEIRASPTSGG